MNKLIYIIGAAIVVISSVANLFFFGTRGYNGYHGTQLTHACAMALGGVAMGWMGIRMVRSADRNKRKTDAKNAGQQLDDFKMNADVIRVNLAGCEIKGNDYRNERVVEDNSKADEMAALLDWQGFPALRRDTSITEIASESVLVFEHEYLGVHERFMSEIIYKHKTTLQFMLEAEQWTCIYVDKDDRKRYYFDVEVLKA